MSLLVALSTVLGFAVIDHWVLPGPQHRPFRPRALRPAAADGARDAGADRRALLRSLVPAVHPDRRAALRHRHRDPGDAGLARAAAADRRAPACSPRSSSISCSRCRSERRAAHERRADAARTACVAITGADRPARRDLSALRDPVLRQSHRRAAAATRSSARTAWRSSIAAGSRTWPCTTGSPAC